jgi:hypothetical protein
MKRLLEIMLELSVDNILRIKRLSALAALALLSLSMVPRAYSQDDQCNQAITSVKDDITIRLGGSIWTVREGTVNNSPYKEAGRIVFMLGSYDYRDNINSNIMNSTKLLTGYADSVIRSCSNVVQVGFGNVGGGYSRSFSWIDNRYTRDDECVDPRSRNYRWGQEPCI